MMTIKCDLKLKCKHRSQNGFHSIMFEQKDEKREKSILMPLIFAHYGRWLNIGKVAFPGGNVESLPGLLDISRLSLSNLELSQSRFNLAKLPLW